MKRSYFYIFGLFLLAGLMLISSCEERVVLDYTPYNPAAPEKFTYPDAVFYPVLEILASDTPTIKVDGNYVLDIDTAYTSEGGKFLVSKFKIDDATGVITYDNSDGSINPGDYTVDVSVFTVNSKVDIPGAYKFTINDVPVSLTAEPTEYVAGALEEGVISIVTATDETSDNSLVVDNFLLNPSVQGFSIDIDGNIIKTTLAPTDTTIKLSVKVITNLGAKTFNNIVTVTVGSPPEINYAKAAGGTLTKVTLSPWTAYTTQKPELTGMDSDGGWDIIVSDPDIDKTAFSVDDEGRISILAEQRLPEGEFMLGVTVTNASGNSFAFDSLFTVLVEKRWDETSLIVNEDFNDVELGPLFAGYVVNNADHTETFGANHFVKDDPHRDIRSARFLGGLVTGVYDATLVLDIDLTQNSDARDLKISFGQLYGYGATALTNYERTLAYSYNNEPASGVYDPANWNELMSATDDKWLTDNLWNSTTPYDDVDDGDGFGVVLIPQSPFVEFGGIDPTQSNVYVCWRYRSILDPTTAKAQWIIDNVKVEAARAFTAIEE
jgi:hypothetical protein